MSNDPVDGGTVTYHRAEWIAERDRWVVTFPNGRVQGFTAEQGEAMGLTPPEPAPLVVTCQDPDCLYPGDCFGVKENGRTTWRLPREAIERYHPDAVWPQPEQDDTPSDNRDTMTQHPHNPMRDDTASGIDFDALPIGTVLWDGLDFLLRLPGGWTYNPPADEHDYYDPERHASPYTVVYQPAPLSPGECLRGLLAGRDDADELIEYAARYWRKYDDARHTHVVLVHAIGDAAREVHG